MPTPARPSDLPPGSAPPAADEAPPPNETEDEAARVLLGKLHRVSAPPDLASRVPDLIQRRSAGRFFTKRRIADRLPLEWVSLVMLAVLALIYAVLRMAPALLGSN